MQQPSQSVIRRFMGSLCVITNLLGGIPIIVQGDPSKSPNASQIAGNQPTSGAQCKRVLIMVKARLSKATAKAKQSKAKAKQKRNEGNQVCGKFKDENQKNQNQLKPV